MSNMLDWAKREVEIACKKENPNQSVEIVNAFDGEEAVALYKKLTTVKKGE